MAKQTKQGAAAAQAAIDAANVDVKAPEPVRMAGEKGVVVLVRAQAESRRRGGRTFGPADAEIDLGEIAEADMKAILADPLLSVRPKPADADAAEKPAA